MTTRTPIGLFLAILAVLAYGLLGHQDQVAPEPQACVVDATAHQVVAKDSTTLYTVAEDGTHDHFQVDPAVLAVTRVGDYYAEPTDCVEED